MFTSGGAPALRGTIRPAPGRRPQRRPPWRPPRECSRRRAPPPGPSLAGLPLLSAGRPGNNERKHASVGIMTETVKPGPVIKLLQ
eukprot:1179365-Prorocentrum_minimum.AAC.2